MNTNFWFIPSFYALVINGFFLLITIILLYKNYSKISRIEPYKSIVLIILLSYSIGLHGILHLGLEKTYDYNPIKQFINIVD